MKRFTKVIAVISALVLACAFVGCKNDTSSDDTSSSDSIVTPDNDSTSDDGSTSNSDSSSSTQKQIVSEWESNLPPTYTLVFYSDGTVENINSVSSALNVFGTYTGDASKDGEITFKGQTVQGVSIAFTYSKATINGDKLTATLSTGSSKTAFTKKK